MAPDAAAQREIDHLTAEVERLRALEGGLLAERERIRADAASEIAGLQDALRAAAGHAGAVDVDSHETRELSERARHVAERERMLGDREATLAAGEGRLAKERGTLDALSRRLDAERARLRDERTRLQQESDRLAEWEREALVGGPPTPLPTTFREGLNRLAESSDERRASPRGSW